MKKKRRDENATQDSLSRREVHAEIRKKGHSQFDYYIIMTSIFIHNNMCSRNNYVHDHIEIFILCMF